jgi:ribosome-associated toxin RatA of RatAB toxin-antitoxin module
MRTVDRIRVHAPFAKVFAAASTVVRWPAILPHYRWVRVLEDGLVEMAAWRPFAGGLLKYPTWWVSHMTVDPAAGEIRYRHVRGITRQMQVVWRLVEVGGGSESSEGSGSDVDIEIVHTWDGPRWPLIGRWAANLVIGPVFIHGIASRTLAGIKRAVERSKLNAP